MHCCKTLQKGRKFYSVWEQWSFRTSPLMGRLEVAPNQLRLGCLQSLVGRFRFQMGPLYSQCCGSVLTFPDAVPVDSSAATATTHPEESKEFQDFDPKILTTTSHGSRLPLWLNFWRSISTRVWMTRNAKPF